MLEQIQTGIEKLLQAAGVANPGALLAPPKPEMGDVAFACFELSKEQKQSPVEVAKGLAAKLASSLPAKKMLVEKVQAFGPYVNFFLNSGAVVEMVVNEVKEKKELFGFNRLGVGRKTLIEYPSNNTHKEFHVGHFRNVCIGNALVKIYEASGYVVYPINYLNDFGAHVAKCLWGLRKFHAAESPPQNKQKWLGDIYVEASHYVKEHPEAADEVASVQQKLEAHDSEWWPLYMQTREWSVEKFNELFKELAVRHVAEFYEKDVKQAAQRTVDELLAKGIAKVGEGGAIIIDLTAFGLDIALVRKSNGVALYLTSDLPLAQEKFKKFNVDESIIITGQEQNFYFRQLYKILELMGFKKKLTHIGYGLINTLEGKMSSRLGNVILYEDLRDEVYRLVRGETNARHPEWGEERVNAVARALALAALKFDMQKHEAAKNIVFDVKEAASFTGFSGPYVLYVVARINSIMRKAEAQSSSAAPDFSALTAPSEKDLGLLIANYHEAVVKALNNYNPSAIARYCFDLAQAFNDFYSHSSILNAASPALVAARLALAAAARQALVNALGLLTIETVEEM